MYKRECQSAYVLADNPSGFSVGSAVATSSGFSAATLGHDTYGSCIIPAGRNALFAIKPCRGLVSRTGAHACSEGLDTILLLTKSAYDTALLLGLTAGTDIDDPLCKWPCVRSMRRMTVNLRIHSPMCSQPGECNQGR
jgi:Asp-tRNA(Asn)/Glu-tRNA(Gln) amidotransferase A subunit family amidase